jgi:HK97 family phage major capsid protein
MTEIKDMTIEEVEVRASEIQKEVESADETRMAELKTELDALEERKNELKRMAAEAKETREMVAEGKVDIDTIETVIKEEKRMTNKEIVATPEYRDAFANYIRTGDDKECRALLTENVSGDVPVASIVYDIVKNAWEKEGIVARIKKTYVKGNLRVGFEISADGAFIHTEGQTTSSASAENLVLGTVNIVASNIKKFIYVSDEVIDSTEFLTYVYDELVYQIAKKLADTVIAKIEACGTVSTNTPSVNVGVPVVTAASIALDTIAQAIASISDQATDPVIIMNKATFASFKAVQAAGSYGYDPFEGLPVLFNNTVKAFAVATTGDTYAIVGDLGEGMIANFPNGEEIKIKLDDLSLAESDMVKIVGRQYVGVEVVGPASFAKIQK